MEKIKELNADARKVKICKDVKTDEEIRLSSEDRNVHTLIAGPQGTDGVNSMMASMINQDLRYDDNGLVTFSTSGLLAESSLKAIRESERKDKLYFSPTYQGSCSYNPLLGEEKIVVENIVASYRAIAAYECENSFFMDNGELLLRYSVSIIKKVYGDNATIVDLSDLMNLSRKGVETLNKYKELNLTEDIDKSINAFYDEYSIKTSKLYNHCSGVRALFNKLLANSDFHRITNPSNKDQIIDFNKIIKHGGVLIIDLNQGLLSDTVLQFLKTSLMHSLSRAIFSRDTSCIKNKQVFIYLEQLDLFLSNGIQDLLTQGRVYKSALCIGVKSISDMEIIDLNRREYFKGIIINNTRNKIIYPGLDHDTTSELSKCFYGKKFKKYYDAINYDNKPNQVVYTVFRNGEVSDGVGLL